MEARHMRTFVREAYPAKSWKDKVDRMPDSQIIALYYSLLKQGRIKN